MAENDNRQMRTYGDEEKTGRSRYKQPKTISGAMPPFYKIPAGKDIMLKDISYRLENRAFGKDIFEDMAWLERRLFELSNHKDGSSYVGTEYNWEARRKLRIKITKEDLVEKISQKLEDVKIDIYNHTIPVIIVNEAMAILEATDSTLNEMNDCKSNLEGILSYMISEDSPEEFYMSPTYDRSTGELVRKRVKKDEVISVAMDLSALMSNKIKDYPNEEKIARDEFANDDSEPNA